MRLVMLLFVLVFLTSCSTKLNTDYLKAKNGKVVTIPNHLSKAEISHQFVLSQTRKPITVNYDPPMINNA